MIAMEKLISSYIRCDDAYHYEFEVDGEVVGECEVCLYDRYIHSLCVYPQYRNRGYARQMLLAIMSMFRGQRMWLRAYSSNIPAIKAYTAVGFSTFEISNTNCFGEEVKVSNMEVIAPTKTTFQCVKHYGISAHDGNVEMTFSNESDRAEMALALYEEWVYDLWNRTINWYDIPEEEYQWELERAEEDVREGICTYEVIHIEEV